MDKNVRFMSSQAWLLLIIVMGASHPNKKSPKDFLPTTFHQLKAGKGKGKAPVVGVDGNWLCVQCENAWSPRRIAGSGGGELQVLDAECEMFLVHCVLWLKMFYVCSHSLMF